MIIRGNQTFVDQVPVVRLEALWSKKGHSYKSTIRSYRMPNYAPQIKQSKLSRYPYNNKHNGGIMLSSPNISRVSKTHSQLSYHRDWL